MSKKRQAPWERSDFLFRFTVIPWSVQYDKALSVFDKEVFGQYGAEAFIVGGSIVKLSTRQVAKWSGLGRPVIIAAIRKLTERGHLEPLEQVKVGRTTVYKLTSVLFASPEVIVTSNAGNHKVEREALEELRKRFSASRNRVGQ